MISIDNLRKLRQQKGISQFELAEMLGVSQQTVSKYEKGTREPDNATLIRLSKIFNCSVDYLLGHTEVPVSTDHSQTVQPRNLEDYIKEAESLMLFGDIVDENDREALLTAIKIAYETAIKKNKERKKKDNM
jgi:transcriptional regulator with XRE-family HTH domain